MFAPLGFFVFVFLDSTCVISYTTGFSFTGLTLDNTLQVQSAVGNGNILFFLKSIYLVSCSTWDLIL